MGVYFSDRLTHRALLRLTFPSIIMLVFTSIYGVVDGFFVSNFVGKTAFTAVNFVMPFLMVLGSIGFMFGTGGGALIAKTIGEGDHAKANRIFSMLIYISIFGGALLSVLGFLLIRPLLQLLGAEGALLDDSVRYGRWILIAIPAYILQFEFQCLFATAAKPKLGLYVTVAAGCTNMVLDALFVGLLPWGLDGAAAATAISQCVGGIVPLVYFARKNGSLLQLGRPYFHASSFGKICVNGSSELMSNISMSIVSMLYNLQLLRYAGEDGVAAYGVLMYVSFVFQAVFIGYSVGVAPAISYHFGARLTQTLQALRKKSLFLIGVFAVCMCATSLVFSRPLSKLFVGYDAGLYALTVHGFSIFSLSFLFSGFAIFGSSFFTALNNGLVSAAISFLRTLVFQIAAVLLLPLLWDIDGIWISIVVAEVMALIVTVIFLKQKQAKYQY